MPPILIAIQARLGSKRFPQKILAPVDDGKETPVLAYMLDKLLSYEWMVPTKVVTIVPPGDHEKILTAIGERFREHVMSFDIDEDDVLGRYKALVDSVDCSFVVRLTADCPFVPVELIKGIIENANIVDPSFCYISNTVIRTFPDGWDIEVLTPTSIKLLEKTARNKEEREHVTLHAVRELNFAPFISCVTDYSFARCTIDYPEDKMSGETSPTFFDYIKKSKSLGGAQTKSKSTPYLPEVPFALKTKRCFIETTHDNLLDWTMGLGAVKIGYTYVPIDKIVISSLREMNPTCSFPTHYEILASEKILEHTPHCSWVRWLNNGTDAVSLACRLARAYTGKRKILTTGYHGFSDGLPSFPVEGMLEGEIERISFNRLPKDWNYAALLLSPDGSENLIRELVKRAQYVGMLVIMDEVITGFRSRVGQRFEGLGDIICYGKAIGNGWPVACMAGTPALREKLDKIHASSTFGGAIPGLVAAKSTISVLERMDWETHQELGEKLLEGLREKGWPIGGSWERPVISFDTEKTRNDFAKFCLSKKMACLGAFNLSFSHTEEHVDYTLEQLDIL